MIAAPKPAALLSFCGAGSKYEDGIWKISMKITKQLSSQHLNPKLCI